MHKYTLILSSTALILGLGIVPAAHAQQQSPLSFQQLSSFMKDHGSNDTLTLEQANKAAESHFGRLDTDHDGTVDKNELIPAGVSDKDFTFIDPDKDNLVQKDEYLHLIKQKFDTADRDHNNKLTKDELNSEDGQSLMRLIQ